MPFRVEVAPDRTEVVNEIALTAAILNRGNGFFGCFPRLAYDGPGLHRNDRHYGAWECRGWYPAHLEEQQ